MVLEDLACFILLDSVEEENVVDDEQNSLNEKDDSIHYSEIMKIIEENVVDEEGNCLHEKHDSIH